MMNRENTLRTAYGYDGGNDADMYTTLNQMTFPLNLAGDTMTLGESVNHECANGDANQAPDQVPQPPRPRQHPTTFPTNPHERMTYRSCYVGPL